MKSRRGRPLNSTRYPWSPARLVGLRLAAGISERQLAARARWSVNTVWQLETGRRKPTDKCVEDLARALGVQPTSFGGRQRREESRI
jgi:transcriptional regulator with XRE-family HTH domain